MVPILAERTTFKARRIGEARIVTAMRGGRLLGFIRWDTSSFNIRRVYVAPGHEGGRLVRDMHDLAKMVCPELRPKKSDRGLDTSAASRYSEQRQGRL